MDNKREGTSANIGADVFHPLKLNYLHKLMYTYMFMFMYKVKLEFNY